MSIALDREQLRAITAILVALPEFGTARKRRRLVAAALAGTERGGVLLSRLDLEGSPRSVAGEVVLGLAEFGQVAYDREAIAVLLDHVRELVDEEDAAVLANVLRAHDGGPLAARSRPLDPTDGADWRGGGEVAGHLERILGENTLRDVRYLRRAARAAEAVVRLKVAGGERAGSVGTGFLVGDGLIMTNHHVVASPEEASVTEVAFHYELDEAGRPRAVVPATVVEGGAFATDAALDVTVFEIAGVGNGGIDGDSSSPVDGHVAGARAVPAPLILSGRRVRADERVAIVQHPGGHLKKISLQHNHVVFADARTVQYTTATEPGSSGAPVLDDELAVVAVHHSGGILSDPATAGKRIYCNGGTSARAIRAMLAETAPAIAARLAGA